MPSSRRQISSTAADSSADKSRAARSLNSSTAATTSSEGTRHNRSSARPSPSRLVDRIFTVADLARMRSIRSAAASTTCSQLSKTRRRTLPSKVAATDSLIVMPGCCVMPSTAATASGTAAGSATEASSKTQTPSGNSSARTPATSSANRVLPTPPTPANVTSRCDRIADATSSTSSSRPISLLAAGRRFP